MLQYVAVASVAICSAAHLARVKSPEGLKSSQVISVIQHETEVRHTYIHTYIHARTHARTQMYDTGCFCYIRFRITVVDVEVIDSVEVGAVVAGSATMNWN